MNPCFDAARCPGVGAVVRVGETWRQVTGVYDGVIAYRETTAADQAAAQWGMWRETGITFCLVAEWQQWAAQVVGDELVKKGDGNDDR